MDKLILGPLLGLEGKAADKNTYTFCFVTGPGVTAARVNVNDKTLTAERVDIFSEGIFWRASTEISAPAQGRSWVYSVAADSQRLANQTLYDNHGRNNWCFYVPGTEEAPKIAYTSCNGVSKSDLITKLEQPFYLWEEMARQHGTEPFSLLLMGGDQVYADAVWDKVPELTKWSALNQKEQIKRTCTKAMADQLDRFYSKLYVERWNEASTSLMLASIPSLMMWDDHDIFDGWGSFPDTLQTCEVFAGVFAAAQKYFTLFQLRSHQNANLIDPPNATFSQRLTLRDYTVLALDNRSERRVHQVMSADHWRSLLRELDTINSGHLLVMSAVPVVYRDFSLTETAFKITPWDEELTDDLKDHWRAKEHQGERSRLIMRLLTNARTRQQTAAGSKTIILSGDVHVGCLGVIADRTDDSTVKVHQLVSSGIVHPAPSTIAWLGIQAVTNDRTEYLNDDRGIEITMLKPFGSDTYIRARNFATLKMGTDKKIWINWITEETDKPEYPIS